MHRSDPLTSGSSPIVLFGNVPFASPRQRCQQFALGLAQSDDVAFVDPNRSVLSDWLRGRRVGVDESLPERLTHVRPPPGLPFARTLKTFHFANCRRTMAALRGRLEASDGWPPRLAIVTSPDQLPCVDRLGATPLVYDVMDEPELFFEPRQRPRIAAWHRELLARADLIATSSRVLLNRCRDTARRVECVTNGVGDRLFETLPTTEPRDDLATLPRPRFGYVGAISHWFDFDAIRELATAFRRGSILLVGPCDVRRPSLPDNVIWLGPVDHRDLASALRSFDIGLIPFRRSWAIDAVNPVKLFEYLAAGLPVISSAFVEIEEYSRFVDVYDDRTNVAEAARRALARQSVDVRTRRDFAANHRWSIKVAEFRRFLANSFGGDSTPSAGRRAA